MSMLKAFSECLVMARTERHEVQSVLSTIQILKKYLLGKSEGSNLDSLKKNVLVLIAEFNF